MNILRQHYGFIFLLKMNNNEPDLKTVKKTFLSIQWFKCLDIKNEFKFGEINRFPPNETNESSFCCFI